MKTLRKRMTKGLTLGIVAALTMLVSSYEALDQEAPFNQELITQDFSSEFIPGEYIVELHPSAVNFRKSDKYEDVQAGMRKLSSEILFRNKISPENLRMVYGHAMDGFSVQLSDQEFEALRKDPRVKHIEQDQVITLSRPNDSTVNNRGGGNGGGNGGNNGGGPKKNNTTEPAPTDPEPTPTDPEPTPENPESTEPEPTPTEPEPSPEPEPIVSGPSTQEVPWGIKRVGGFTRYTGTNVAFILDTGIELDHPDLNVFVSLGIKIVPDDISTTLSDLHSHGTHVAGIVGAIDNNFGVVGVAAGAPVVPVKIMGDDGRGRVSWAIAGVDYVASVGKPGDVANLSIGASASTTFDNAVINASNKGIWFVTSAGNSADDANNYSPARANGPFLQTVSSMDSSDRMASSSNYGNPPIDWAAPGVSIRSTVLRGGYGSKNGTSMAAPHVAGLRLLGNIRGDGFIKNDKDSTPDPIAHRAN
ncbi:S8 family serine peptidase [Belliella pelovolcani]|uniref:S8 family serine peptidase n=1 Tax=Belliella pelovolcani TaxID=529505 RepID=UPI0039188AA7